MKVSGLLMVSLAVIAAMVVSAFWISGMVPEAEQLPIHWNIAGKADGWAAPLIALLIAPTVLLLASLFFAVIPMIEPLQEKLEGSAPVMRVAWIGLIAMMVMVQAMIASSALGVVPQPSLVFSAVGIFLVVMGNTLPKSRPGFFIGIRTPWTITDTDNWIATHRFGGKLMMGAGLIWIFNPFLPLDENWRFGLLMTVILSASFVPMIYSWWLWKRKGEAV